MISIIKFLTDGDIPSDITLKKSAASSLIIFLCHYTKQFGDNQDEQAIVSLGGQKQLEFVHKDRRLLISGLPVQNPDQIAGCPVLKIVFNGTPKQVLSGGMILLAEEIASWW